MAEEEIRLVDQFGIALPNVKGNTGWPSVAFRTIITIWLCAATGKVIKDYKPKTIALIEGTSVSPAKWIDDKGVIADADYAANAWNKAMRVRFKPIDFKLGDAVMDCHARESLACYVAGTNTIFITPQAQELSSPDRRTILMHEIGHALGVPHIEGDPLMETIHDKNVSGPTPFAVAIAKANANR